LAFARPKTKAFCDGTSQRGVQNSIPSCGKWTASAEEVNLSPFNSKSDLWHLKWSEYHLTSESSEFAFIARKVHVDRSPPNGLNTITLVHSASFKKSRCSAHVTVLLMYAFLNFIYCINFDYHVLLHKYRKCFLMHIIYFGTAAIKIEIGALERILRSAIMQNWWTFG
jgi:hypothetical protein